LLGVTIADLDARCAGGAGLAARGQAWQLDEGARRGGARDDLLWNRAEGRARRGSGVSTTIFVERAASSAASLGRSCPRCLSCASAAGGAGARAGDAGVASATDAGGVARLAGRASSSAREREGASSAAGSRARTAGGAGRAAGAGRAGVATSGATDFERRRITVSLMRSSVVLSCAPA